MARPAFITRGAVLLRAPGSFAADLHERDWIPHRHKDDWRDPVEHMRCARLTWA